MIDFIKKLLTRSDEQESGTPGGRMQGTTHVAACALLLEMAAVDGQFSRAEKENIVFILKKEYDLSHEVIDELLTISTKELNDSVDLWQFARVINEHYSAEEKLQVMEMIWKVVYADGHLDQHEDYLAHKLGKLLRLSHQQLIEAKLRVVGKDYTSQNHDT